MATAPLTAAQLVLRSRHINEDAVANLIAAFGLSPPSWHDVVYPHQSDADALRAARWLHARHPEQIVDQWGHPDTYIMDMAARNGFLSVLRFLHEHRTEGCSSRAMDKYGHWRLCGSSTRITVKVANFRIESIRVIPHFVDYRLYHTHLAIRTASPLGQLLLCCH